MKGNLNGSLFKILARIQFSKVPILHTLILWQNLKPTCTCKKFFFFSWQKRGFLFLNGFCQKNISWGIFYRRFLANFKIPAAYRGNSEKKTTTWPKWQVTFYERFKAYLMQEHYTKSWIYNRDSVLTRVSWKNTVFERLS